jgi:hypothetical protein
MAVTIYGVELTIWFTGSQYYTLNYSYSIHTLQLTTVLQTILTEYHDRVFTRQGSGPRANPLTISELRALLLTHNWQLTQVPNSHGITCHRWTWQASKQAVAYCWHSPAWLFLVSGPIGTHDQSQSHITTDDQSVSASWFRVPSGAHDQMLITVWQLLFCRYRAPPLTRGRVCHLS